jgi:multidrug efflux pump subunit AcrA (membrane-fusion protein)
MIRKYIIPLLAIAGLAAGVLAVKRSTHHYRSVPPAAQPAENPYTDAIAASGIVEPASRSIAVSPFTNGVVSHVYVVWNQHVLKGQKLFQLDTRLADAQVAMARAGVLAARAQLEQAEATVAKLESPPRAVDRLAFAAAVQAAEATYTNDKERWHRIQPAIGTHAISADDVANRRFAWLTAKAQLARAKANLAQFNAGTWSRDIAIGKTQVRAAQATVALNEAQLKQALVNLNLLTVRAPINGTILRINIRPGQFVAAASVENITDNPQAAALILGNIRHLNVRLQIDQEDASRFDPAAPARCFVRGMTQVPIALTFVRIEPFVIPKQNLTGAPTEQVETRVLQVVYRMSQPPFPVYVGQQVDAFIQAGKLIHGATKSMR